MTNSGWACIPRRMARISSCAAAIFGYCLHIEPSSQANPFLCVGDFFGRSDVCVRYQRDIPALPASWNLALERVTWRSKHIDLENRPSVKPQVPCSRVALSLVQSQKRTAIIDGEAAAPCSSRNDSDAGSTKQPNKKLCTAGLNVMSRDCCSVGSSMSRCAQLVLPDILGQPIPAGSD